MKIIELISILRNKGIKLSVNTGKLAVDAPKGALDELLIEEIKNNKDDLINFIVLNSQEFKIPEIEIATSYPLSHSQKRFWVLDQLEDNNTAYNIHGSFYLEGLFSEEIFEKAYHYILERHESLRTVFILEDGEPRQKILDSRSFNISIIDIRECSNTQEEILRYSEKDIQTVFNLEKGPLFRFTVLRISDKKYLILFNMHHIISDGWSLNILIRDFLLSYNCFTNGRVPELEPLRIQYKDYSSWQNSSIESSDLLNQKKYWLNKLAGEIPVLNLPCDNIRPAFQTFNGTRYDFSLSNDVLIGMKDLCRDNGVSLFMMLNALLKTLFYRYTNQEDIIIGSPIAGRIHDDLKDQIGLYINTLALRDSINSEAKFTHFLKQVSTTCLEAFQNQDYPFDRLVEELNLKRDLSRSPLFDVMLVFQNDEKTEIEFEGLELTPHDVEDSISRFDIVFEFTETDTELFGSLEFNTDIYTVDRIKKLTEHFEVLVKSVLTSPDSKISELEIIPEEEKQLLIDTFNNTFTPVSEDKTITNIFEASVKKFPENTAIVYKGRQFSYEYINERSNKVAWYLINNFNIGSGDLVAVIMDRSEKMIITLLGVLKAGGAYIPIDPEFPKGRIDYMVEDSNPKVIVTDTIIEDILSTDISCENPIRSIESKNLAYVIYTSGSTGKPKGTLITHGNVVNFIKGITDRIDFNIDKTILSVTTFSFDIFVLESFLPLSIGQKIVLANNEEQSDPYALWELIEKNSVDMIQTTPSRMKMLTSENPLLSKLPQLTDIMVGGEAFPQQLLDKLKSSYNGNIFNMYGPTETTVWSTLSNLNESDFVHIGKPIANTQIYILDSNKQLVPQGVFGELYISGKGVSLGYLNKPELTKEKFIENPFNSKDRIYHTGDSARWLKDGNIEFRGRLDNQVKIRGYRIELGEIEHVLTSHSSITTSLIIDKEDANGDKFLIAYYVSNSDIDQSELRHFLGKSLPAYLIPSYFISITSIPLLPNGKTDRKGLPEPDGSLTSGKEYVPPESDIEENLANIWADVLRVDKIGVNDNFFDLGAHSLKALGAISRINKELEKTISLKEVFTNPTVRELSKVLEQKGNIKRDKSFNEPVTISLKDNFIFNKKNLDPKNLQFAVLSFKNKPDQGVVKKICKEMISNHDAFNLSLTELEGNLVLEKKKDNNLLFKESICSSYNEFLGEIKKERINPLDNEFIKFIGADLKENYYLAFVIHSTFVDNHSWGVIIKDFETALRQTQNNREISLPSQTDPYLLWANYISEQKNKYSVNSILDVPKLLIKEEDIKHPVSFFCELSMDKTDKLINDVNRTFLTDIDDILLTALTRTLYKWTGNSKTLLNLQSNCRDITNELDLIKTVGGFKYNYPLLLELSEDSKLNNVSFNDILAVKEQKAFYCNRTIKNDDSIDVEINYSFSGDLQGSTNNKFFTVNHFPEISGYNSLGQKINKLNFNSYILDGIMSIGLESNCYSESVLKELSVLFNKELQDLIDLCISVKEKSLLLFETNENKLLNIKSVQNSCNCLEDAALTILYSLDIEHRVMFFDSWSFLYNKDLATDKLGEKIMDFTNEDKFLLEYHGVLWKRYENNQSDDIERVLKELKENRPILLPFNMRFAPWSYSFMDDDDQHVLVISGYNLKKQAFYCTDSLGYQEACELPFDSFIKGAQVYLTLSRETINKEIQLEQFFKELIDNFERKNTLENLRFFAEDIKNNLDIKKEVEGVEDLEFCSLHLNFYNNLKRTRKNFSGLIDCINYSCSTPVLDSLNFKFKDLASQYERVRVFLRKAVSGSFPDNLNDQFSNLIFSLVDKENSLYKYLKECSESGEFKNLSFKLNSSLNNELESSRLKKVKPKEAYHLDLKNYFCNNGIGTTVGTDSDTDFTGLGHYMLLDETEDVTIWQKGAYSFAFPLINNNSLDNISCQNQKIKISKSGFSHLAILACSDWGNYFQPMEVVYKNGETQKILLEVKDWDILENQSRDILWKGRSVEQNGNIATLTEQTVCIQAITYRLKSLEEIDFIILPDCPTIHIFSMTLYKEN